MTPEEFFKNNPGKNLSDYYKWKFNNSKEDDIGKEGQKQTYDYIKNETINYDNQTLSNDSFLKKQIIISSLGILCFFTPWFTFSFGRDISISGYDITKKIENSISGYDISKNFELVWFIIIGFVVNIILIVLDKTEFLIIRTILFIIPFIYFFFKIKDVTELVENVDQFGLVNKIFDQTINISFGFYISILMIFLIHFIKKND